MTIQNDFLPFAASENANVLEQADYEKLVARRTGFTSGVAMAAQLNKVWRQSSLMAAALARFIVERSGQPLIDDGTTQAIVNHLHAAIAEVDLAWSKITGKPTTLTGYGITDAVNVEEKGQPEGVATLNAQGHVPTEQLPRSKVDLAWSKITGKPTTLTGYGITDAVNVEEKGQPEGVATLDDQGYVPTEQLPALDFTPADGSITTPKLADDAVTSSKIAYGAIVNNIGYTPLGTKGDQAIDGTLNVRYWLHIRNPNDSALRSVHHNDGTIGFVGPRGWMARFGDDGNLWTPIFGWLSNTLNAKLGAQGDQKIEGALTVRSSLFLYDPGNHTTRMLRNWANELQLGPSNAYAVAIHDDGTLWSRAYGQLHDYFARKSELNTKQPAGNYVMGINNRYLLKWDNGLHAFVDSTYVGRLWTHQNFNPNTKADLDWVKSVLNGKADTAYVNNRLNDKADGAWVNDMLRGKANAGAECQHDSNIWDYGVMKGDSTSKVQDLPNPWVVTGLSAVWLTEDRLHGIGMRARKIRNQ